MKIRKELWFGFSLMALIGAGALYMLLSADKLIPMTALGKAFTFGTGRKSVAADRTASAKSANKVLLQVGSQQRSDAKFRQACELVRNGRLGKLQQIHVSLPPDSPR